MYKWPFKFNKDEPIIGGAKRMRYELRIFQIIVLGIIIVLLAGSNDRHVERLKCNDDIEIITEVWDIENDKLIKSFDLEKISFGGGKNFYVNNLVVPSSASDIEFILETKTYDRNLENNIVELKAQ